MLLGDRTFIDRTESVDFQKTGVFHVLVVAGLHVGALAFFLTWLFRRMHLPRSVSSLLLLCFLAAYVAVVEQRVPVLRAGIMVAIVVVESSFHRRLDLLNSAGLAALGLLVANPQFLNDGGFQLSFLAIACIAGLASPLLNVNLQPFVNALKGWRDRTRDVSYAPLLVQFRLDIRSVCLWFSSGFSGTLRSWMQDDCVQCLRGGFHLAELFVLSFVLQVGMLPLMARDFHRVSVLGPIANLFVVPITGAIVPAGFFTLGMSLAFPTIAKYLAVPLSLLVSIQAQIVSWLAHIPASSYRIPSPSTWVLFSFFTAGIVLLFGYRLTGMLRRNLLLGAGTALLLSASLIVIYPFHPSTTLNSLEVAVLEVGQGDAILVISPLGSTLLIDAGGAFEGFRGRLEHLGSDPGEEVVSPYLWSRGFKTLNAVAVTHAHQDHIGGMSAILDNFKVGRLWIGNDYVSPALLRLKAKAKQQGVPLEHQRRGQHFLWDGVEVHFLWPDSATDATSDLARNNDSLVVRLRYGDRTILLPGDAEKQVEYSILSTPGITGLHADVLKVGHHGSKNSTIPEFLSAVNPQVAIVSAGEQNPYGHPSPELLERLTKNGVRVLRTDKDGAIQAITDGHIIYIHCFVDGSPGGTVLRNAEAPDQSQSN